MYRIVDKDDGMNKIVLTDEEVKVILDLLKNQYIHYENSDAIKLLKDLNSIFDEIGGD